MRIEVRGRNTEVTHELRGHVENNSRIGKQASELAVLEVELREERNPSIADSQVAEATLHDWLTLRASEASPEIAVPLHTRAGRGPPPPGQAPPRQAPQACPGTRRLMARVRGRPA